MTDGNNNPTPRVEQMMDGDQSLRNVPTQRVDLLSPKTKIKIGNWNVRTLFQASKLVQAVGEMDNYNLGMLAVTEARWTNCGKQRLTSGETIMWSGKRRWVPSRRSSTHC